MIKNLAGKWSFIQATGAVPAALAKERKGWSPATVPGCVHLDLMAAKRIPDPFYGLNENEVQWVEAEDWLYSHVFECSEEMLEAGRVELVCDGLDTYATVILNGRKLGTADNMFCAWRWDVTGLLKAENNSLVIAFESPVKRGNELAKKHGPVWLMGKEWARSYVRKAQYAGGWDWGPKLNSFGIWKPIYLESWDAARITDVFAPVDWPDPKRPVLKVEVAIEALKACEVKLKAELEIGGSAQSVEFGGRVRKGTATLHAEIPVRNPQLWWPAGQGAQPLYTLKVRGTAGSVPLDERTITVALRRVELKRQKDNRGESFVFEVNGRPVFCKGANWIPADSLLPRVIQKSYEELIEKAIAANMNMLRVWGGGIYEGDGFYDACDRAGIMIWQDFMFACAGYPDNLKWFMESVREEAEQNVRRLRNHPSIVLWCGNNECQWGHEAWGGEPREPWGESIYDELLPDVCAKLDPTRPYWPGSPFGGKEPNSRDAGDQHCWDVWFNWQSAEFYRSYSGRFISEFGMQAPPTLETIREYIPAAERHMQSRTMVHHNKMGAGTERVYRYLAEYFRIPASFEDNVYLMQLVQGEIIKTGVEHWRARKFDAAGALFWQLNDCWPVTSWSCLDSRLRAKALYHYARRFFAPVLAAVSHSDGRLSVKVVNDLPDAFAGELACGMIDVDGVDLWSETVPCEVAANGVKEIVAKEAKALGLKDPTRQFFWCRLIRDRESVSSNTYFFAPYRHVALPTVDWETTVEKIGEQRYELTLEATAFAKGVWLRLDGMGADFEDNFFDVLESVPVKVRMTAESDIEPSAVERRLLIKTVTDAR